MCCSTQSRNVFIEFWSCTLWVFGTLVEIYQGQQELGIKIFSKIYCAPLSGILRQASINTDKQMMVFSDYRCQYFIDTGISKVAYIVFYQGVPIYHCTHVPGPVTSSISEANTIHHAL